MRLQYGLGFQSVSSGSHYEQHLHGFYAKNEFIKIGVNTILPGLSDCRRPRKLKGKDSTVQFHIGIQTGLIILPENRLHACKRIVRSEMCRAFHTHLFQMVSTVLYLCFLEPSLKPFYAKKNVLQTVEVTEHLGQARPHSSEQSKDQNVPKIGGYFSSRDRNTE